jgi:hypothetical protein
MQEVLTSSILKDGRGSKVLTEPLLLWVASVGQEVSEAAFACSSSPLPPFILEISKPLSIHDASFYPLGSEESSDS